MEPKPARAVCLHQGKPPHSSLFIGTPYQLGRRGLQRPLGRYFAFSVLPFVRVLSASAYLIGLIAREDHNAALVCPLVRMFGRVSSVPFPEIGVDSATMDLPVKVTASSLALRSFTEHRFLFFLLPILFLLFSHGGEWEVNNRRRERRFL